MKKFYTLILLVLATLGFSQTPIITMIADGDCTSGTPKVIEIYANGTVDFTQFTLQKSPNGGTWGGDYDLSSFGTLTNAFIYIYTDNTATPFFATEFPSATNAQTSAVSNNNGNDAIRIINTTTLAVIDQYGADNTNGTGEPWEYTDGYAKRNNGTGPDAGFVVGNWTYSNGGLNGGGTCQGGSTFESMMGGIGTYTTTPSTTPTLTASPSSINFGNVTTATTSPAEDVTVIGSNLTTAPTYSITGTDAAMFNATGTLTTSGGTISVTFTPTSIGAKTATLTITSGTLSQTVALSGNGASAGNPYGLDDSAPLGSLMEDFETGTQGSTTMPNNWYNVADLTSDRLWGIQSFNNNKYAQFTAYNGTGAYQNLLISPAVNLDLIQKSNVTFEWNSGYSNGAVLNVYLIQLNAGTMVKNLVTSINDTTNPSGYGAAFNTVTLNLSSYSGIGFLAFEYVGDSTIPTTTTYQVDNVNMPATTQSVIDINDIQSNFVINTVIDEEINFGTKTEVKVYNMMGQVVKTAKVSETQTLDASDLKPGMYIITGDVDGKPISQKVLKK